MLKQSWNRYVELNAKVLYDYRPPALIALKSEQNWFLQLFHMLPKPKKQILPVSIPFLDFSVLTVNSACTHFSCQALSKFQWSKTVQTVTIEAKQERISHFELNRSLRITCLCMFVRFTFTHSCFWIRVIFQSFFILIRKPIIG